MKSILKLFLILASIYFFFFANPIDVDAQYSNQNFSDKKIEDCHPAIPECIYPIQKPELSKNEPMLGEYVFIKDHFEFNIPYTITNGTIKKISMNCDAWSLGIEIMSNKNGKLEIDIPRELLDPFAMVLLDNEEAGKAKWNEPRLTVWFPPDSKKIEIIGGNILTPSSGSCKQTPNHPYSYLLSPLKQTKNDIEPKEIICKEGLGLIFKSSDNSPACVKPSTVTKLIERGWAKS